MMSAAAAAASVSAVLSRILEFILFFAERFHYGETINDSVQQFLHRRIDGIDCMSTC